MSVLHRSRSTALLVTLAMAGSTAIALTNAPSAQAHAPTMAPTVIDPEDVVIDPDVPEEADPVNPLPDVPAAYTRCAPVAVNLGVTRANVSVLNTSCVFGRDFVRRWQSTLCSREPTRGWTKRFTGPGELITLTLSKGNKRIRTDACGA